jgi:hypothetical protein
MVNCYIGIKKAVQDYGVGAGTDGGALMRGLQLLVYFVLIAVAIMWFLLLGPRDYLNGEDQSNTPRASQYNQPLPVAVYAHAVPVSQQPLLEVVSE